ncbi:cell wall hydrolase [Sphingosinicella sp. LHD-64]|uniref:cell wall hydrolase n=1 Tax=Sphingosinicella sp. LHD-64 TaxID=3072139 RepID=UPI00280CC0EB|nr:cell wall hydrolase [Sphingosinicella sp. LHD-64]MDQ8755982.1 cell wall hydrolase [Sphingosinicella sp. LHD-64]
MAASRQSGRSGVATARSLALLGLALTSASCVPGISAEAPMTFVAIEAPTAPAPLPHTAMPTPTAAVSAVSGATGYAFQTRTPLDRLRALDCLAEAVYYEARSENEDGQRAVAQVVINRVRHPAWPKSICGVVYQGPLRAGGGCQFTFTCDGSLGMRPQGVAWARARAIAAEALAGQSYAPVGLSTHYHTNAVSPSWAPRLALTTVIGAHIFYRLPGAGGRPTAFTAAYTGREPIPQPTQIFFRTPTMPAVPELAAAALPMPAAPSVPSDIPQDPRWTASNLPESTVRDEYRQSGQWRADAPAAIAGAR